EQTLDRDEFTVSQIIPEQEFQGEDFGQLPPMRTAAELGFDDSRYADVPDDIRELDPVGRSLKREERRAALEAQSHGEAVAPQAPEAPAYPEEPAGRQPAYDTGQVAYPEQNGGYGAQSYDEQQQTAYDQQGQQSYEQQGQQSYEQAYYAPDAGLPQNGAYTANGGYPEAGSYSEPAQGEHASAQAGAAEPYAGYQEQPYQDDWQQADGFLGGYTDQYAPETESAQAADGNDGDRVGFDRPGTASSAAHELTDAGLPRRGSTPSGSNGAQPVQRQAPAPGPESNGDSGWRSDNDERWSQAAQLRKPKAGGVTSSGLPRRVPKANLVEGAAASTPQGGPQVSRAPEDVRGRLSNLRRGVQRGRSAGSEKNGQATRIEHSGPDSTYNQER
ncbi:ATPase, partial [Streptomyces sp. NPDC006393]